MSVHQMVTDDRVFEARDTSPRRTWSRLASAADPRAGKEVRRARVRLDPSLPLILGLGIGWWFAHQRSLEALRKGNRS